MRITFVLPHAGLAGGIRAIAIHAAGLARRGHRVHVVSQPPRSIKLRHRIKSLVSRLCSHRAFSEGSHLDGLGLDHRVLDACRPVVDSDVPDADVIVGTWWETIEWTSRLSPSKGAKVSFIQGYDPLFYEGESSELFERARATWRSAAHKIVVAKWLVDLGRHEFGDAEISCVPNGVDTRQFFAAPRGKQPIPTVGLVYSTLRCKGVDIALEACRLAAREIAGLRLVAFGIDKLHPSLPLPPGATYIQRPAQDAIRGIYAQCDAWLWSSRMEGFGLVLLEAMACRTPVIATPAGAAPEIVDGRGGLLVRQENPVDMSRALVDICEKPESRWITMSQAAFDVASRHTWDHATDLFEVALAKAIEYDRLPPLPGLAQGKRAL